MARIPQTRDHHLLRFTTVEINIELVAGMHGLQGELATDEIDGTRCSPQIEGTGVRHF
jgi:hypothetical protein